jgi:hypothetical protein
MEQETPAEKGIRLLSQILVLCYNRPDLSMPAVTGLKRIHDSFRLDNQFLDPPKPNVRKLVQNRINQVKSTQGTPFTFTIIMLRDIASLLARKSGLKLEVKKEQAIYKWLEENWGQLGGRFMALLDGRIEAECKHRSENV